MRTNQYIFLGNFKGTTDEIVSLFSLFKNLGKKYKQVYIFFDKENIKLFPGIQEVFNRMNDAYRFSKHLKEPFGFMLNPETKQLDQYIAWELVDKPPEDYVQIKENFADGKKPGRKGLAKRVGVNCKQSVTKLRSIAKKSSGERQRMAHWCANMKSGKK